MEIFKVEALSFRYPNIQEYTLENIGFSLSSGEFAVLCGPSGCGKTTLLRHLKTVLTPCGERTGRVLFCGQPLDCADQRTQSEKIGFVGQSPENQTVTDKVWHELAFGLESLGFDNETIRRRTAEMASFFGIQNLFDKSVSQLSGGQKQILNLASVMAMQPSVLILDEPTSQLDPIAASDFLFAVSRINRELGVTVIMTEHRLDEVIPLADRVLVMDSGKILSDASPQMTGAALKEQNNRILLSMPVPMRIWLCTQNDGGICPVTVGEGRAWLEEFSQTHQLKEPDIKADKQFDGEPVLQAENLWFRYGREQPDVLKGASLKAYKGEFLAVLGGNGTGKTTLLSAISGSAACYRGKVRIFGESIDKIKTPYSHMLGVLPQEPLSLFVKKTVLEDLLEMTDNNDPKDQLLTKAVKLCRLEKLLERHPYDLSGGERQRAALAKVLLTRPKILLLDEPTKGMDADFKQTFAQILTSLCSGGVTVIMVSHDVEFCAEYCDRCAMFFNGETVSEAAPVEFFTENNFYTTSASRMARNIIPSAITADHVITACGGTQPQKPAQDDNTPWRTDDDSKSEQFPQRKTSWLRKLGGFFSLIVFVLSAAACFGKNPIADFFGERQLAKYILLAVSAAAFAVFCGKNQIAEHTSHRSVRKLSKRTIAAAAMILLAVPVTIYFGVYYLGDKKYLFISLLVMLECMLPFFLVFEGRKPQARELVIISVLCALAVAGRAAFYMLPQFKPVMAIVIISGAAFGGETGFLVGALTMLVSNMFFGQGPWTPWQMFAMGITGFLAGVLFQKGLLGRNKSAMAVFGLLAAVVIYGGIMNPASAVMAHLPLNKGILLTYYAAGLPMDIVHGVSTMLFLFVGAKPMLEKLDRVKIKYGLL